MAGRLFYALLLVIVLTTMWLLLSGYWFKPILLIFGALGVATSVFMTFRMGLLDREAAPFGRMVPFLQYWAWLGGEIFKANVQVLRIVMTPDIDIRPTLTRVAVGVESDLARVTYGNSITLTPGTVTVEVEETGFLVHALDDAFTDQEAFRDMERRTARAAEVGGAQG